MPNLIAKCRFSYGVRRLRSGDPFTATKQDARVLVALRKASYAASTEAASPAEQQQKSETADTSDTTDNSEVFETEHVVTQPATSTDAASPSEPQQFGRKRKARQQ